MKGVTLLALVAVIIETSGFLIKVPTVSTQPRVPSSSGWVHLQKLILPLFENVCEESTNPIIVRLAQEFALDTSSGIYLKPEVITNLQNLKTKGFLPKGEIFTNYNFKHTYELQTIYEFLYYAKDFDTFYQGAAWARQNLNCGLFVNAIYLAILNRRDTERLSVPAPYELLPNYFIQKDVIVQASALLSGEEVNLSDNIRDEGNSYILDANYTANYIDNDEESKLAYFHEDIGLNSYFFLKKLKTSPWFNTTPDINTRYGEYLYYMMKQLDTRYNLERYANGFPEVETIDWDYFILAPYDPMLVYSNGNEFGHRTEFLKLIDSENLNLLRTIENNMATVVSHMRDSGYNKTQILNHIMEILVSGERSFETLLMKLIGKDDKFTENQPSVLEHYMTSLRDPIFWKVNKKILGLIDDALKVFPSYTRNELYFPGVEVRNIDIKKMMTSFDYFQFDVTDALQSATTNNAFQVKIGQQRLNHKAFTVKLNISSLVTQKGLVKIFLGPKVAPGEFAVNRNKFMLLDSFEYNFKVGTNVVSRSSEEIQNLADDFTSLRTIRKNVEDAEFGLNSLPFKNVETVLGFPSRLLLPKGTPEGLPLQIFVFVAPFVKSSFDGMSSVPSMEFNFDVSSPGYPLDLDIEDTLLYNLPNVLVKDVLITHKGDKVTNYGGAGATKNWQPNSYDLSSRPNYSAQRKAPFDYQAKKGQYKKEEFASKRVNYSKGNQVTTQRIEPLDEQTDKIEIDDKHQTIIDKNSIENSIPQQKEHDDKDFIDLEPVYEFEQDIENDRFSPLLRSFKLTPYDYLYNNKKHDYYDEDNIDEKIYE